MVVRLFGGATSLLAIDRENEYANSVAATAAGVGAPVIDHLPDEGVLVIGHLEGRTLANQDLADVGQLRRIAESCRTLHGGSRFRADFDMFVTQRRYLDIVRRRVPAATAVCRVRAGGRAHPRGPGGACRAGRAVPQRPARFIDDGDRVWIIDYECSGNNDACFELGNIWSEASLPPEHLDELVTANYRRRLRNKIARSRLLGLMSKYGWTLWASIQHGCSQLDFDFWTWGMEK